MARKINCTFKVPVPKLLIMFSVISTSIEINYFKNGPCDGIVSLMGCGITKKTNLVGASVRTSQEQSNKNGKELP